MRLFKTTFLLCSFFLILNCATPIAPTGGPADKKGPVVEETFPESGAVNFSGKEVKFSFSEFVNRGTFERELNIEPELGIGYSVKWKRKTAIVKFDDDLPDSTTIIVTAGANTSDVRNNKMGSPVQVAFSTGDEIDKGEISGRIRNAETGDPEADQRVLLYRAPFDLTKPANYSSEPDTGGLFRFGYLREGTYKIFVLGDRNRNKIWDREQETAIPFNSEFVELAGSGKDTLDVTYWFEADTIKPVLQAVGLLSSNRMRLRFGEEVRFTSETNIQIQDTSGNNYTTAFPLYIPEEDPFLAFAYSLNPLMKDSLYKINFTGIVDPDGNEAQTISKPFVGSAQEDTVRQDILEFNGENGLLPNQSLVVRFIRPITEREIIDSTVVIEGDVDFKNWPAFSITNNELTISPQGEWVEGLDYRFLVWNPAQRKRQLITPSIWNAIDFGGIEINVQSRDSSDVYRLLLNDEDRFVAIDTTFSNFISIEDLPPVSYQMIIYKDVNGNGVWDRGVVDPFIAPEPYYIQQGVNIQRGFTSEINIDFR